MSNKTPDIEPITFEEFNKICEEAGIAVPDTEQMETDYRVGRALADLAEELCRATEASGPLTSAHEGAAVMVEMTDDLYELVSQGGTDVDKLRVAAVKIAATAIRFVADICHDEKGQN